VPIPSPTFPPTFEYVVYTQNRLQSLISNYVSLTLGADIYLTSQISIDGIYSLIIDGDGYKIDGQNAVRCIYVAGYSTNINLKNLVITNGNAAEYGGGGLYMTACLVSLSNCSVVVNSASYGGGIMVDYATLEVDRCSIGNNDVTLSGGGIYSYGKGYITTIKNSWIYSNNAVYGGGSYVNGGTMILEDTLTRFNYASFEGGAHTGIAGFTKVVHCYVYNNYGYYGGGLNFYDSSFSVIDTTVHSNSAEYGGGVYFFEGDVGHIEGSLITENSAVERTLKMVINVNSFISVFIIIIIIGLWWWSFE
jgi:hypothetical protein